MHAFHIQHARASLDYCCAFIKCACLGIHCLGCGVIQHPTSYSIPRKHYARPFPLARETPETASIQQFRIDVCRHLPPASRGVYRLAELAGELLITSWGSSIEAWWLARGSGLMILFDTSDAMVAGGVGRCCDGPL